MLAIFFTLLAASETSMAEKVLESLYASGPMAIVMGLAIVILWRDRAEAQGRHDAEVEKLRGEAAAERLRFESKFEAQHKEYVALVKDLTEAAKAKDHGG